MYPQHGMLWTSTCVQGFTKKVEQLRVNLDVLTFNSDVRAYVAANGTTKQTEVS
jgi:hypothetical protein